MITVLKVKAFLFSRKMRFFSQIPSYSYIWEHEGGRKADDQAEEKADLALDEGVAWKRGWDKMTVKVPLNIKFCHLKNFVHSLDHLLIFFKAKLIDVNVDYHSLIQLLFNHSLSPAVCQVVCSLIRQKLMTIFTLRELSV